MKTRWLHFARSAGGIDVDATIINRVVLSFVLALLGFGLYKSGFDLGVVLRGLGTIIVEPDILVNDYVAHAGLGPAFVNSGLMAFGAWAMLRLCGAFISGPAIAAVFTVAGFSLFGKNLFNAWPIIGGVALYSWISRRPMKENLIVALFGTALAPITSEFAFGIGIPSPWNIPAGIAAGLTAGFLLPSIARATLDFTRGYNLYNIGFAAGFVGTVTMSVLRAFSVPLSGEFAWAEGSARPVLPFLAAYFVAMIVIGLAKDREALAFLRKLIGSSGRLVSDFARAFGIGGTLVNMGLMGLIGLAFILAAGLDWNGPVLGGLFTLVGFSAFGKHPLNALPPMLGCAFAAVVSDYGISAPASQLACLFVSTLAPISGAYGPVAGFLAGVLHLTLVVNVGILHGGLDLYNNGFSGGMVAGILVPILDWIKEVRRHEA
jgi:hypothetical protein